MLGGCLAHFLRCLNRVEYSTKVVFVENEFSDMYFVRIKLDKAGQYRFPTLQVRLILLL